jgi:hypothetical protein
MSSGQEVRPTGLIPTSESQICELAKAPPGDRSGAWKEATSTAPIGKVTAKHHPGAPA